MPSCSTGFCVAMTMNGSGSMWLAPSALTWRSSIASSSADCVFGEARLISSARTMLANSGPRWKTNDSLERWKMLTPTRSAGSRSGVNCTRFHVQCTDAAIALARLVLPTPGTSSMSRWPSASRHETARSIASFLPCTTRAMLLVMASKSDAKVRVGAVWIAVTEGRVDGARRNAMAGRYGLAA